MRLLKRIASQGLLVGFAALAVLLSLLLRKRRRVLIWGPKPIISNKYWSAAMRRAGHESVTLVSAYYSSINTRGDFDLLFDDVVPRWIRSARFRHLLAPSCAFLYVIRNAAAIHMPFSGGPLGDVWGVWRLESWAYRRAGVRTVVLPYGADAYMYSRCIDPSLRQALLLSYPEAARQEEAITARVAYWMRRADVVICHYMLDGLGRWDVTVFNPFCIDIEQWAPKPQYSQADGRKGPVRIIHTPNHRGFKGTEFLIDAVERLRAEGLQIELVLLERVPNDKVRELMRDADILAEQFIATAYALSAIEGMASGLATLANLEHEAYTRLHRRWGFLDECPILSTTPETLVDNLRALVTNPTLREALGRAGRRYVEKYHGYDASQYMFGAIHDVLLRGEERDLMNLFHPLKSGFNRRLPRVAHPLVENRLPRDHASREGSHSVFEERTPSPRRATHHAVES